MLRKRLLTLTVVVLLAGCGLGGFGSGTEGAGSEPESAEGTGSTNGVAYNWRREGGIAGFCDELAVSRAGTAEVVNCISETVVGDVTLTDDEAAQVAALVIRLDAFEEEQRDPATADAMVVTISFNGDGAAEPTDADIQAINDLSGGLILRAMSAPESLNLTDAEQALRDYFDALVAADYGRAVDLYAGDYTVLEGYNPNVPADDRAALLRQACTANGFNCLPIGEIVESTAVSPGRQAFVVTFVRSDGTKFERGPCCGTDSAVDQMESTFLFHVVTGEDGFYRVEELPVYTP